MAFEPPRGSALINTASSHVWPKKTGKEDSDGGGTEHFRRVLRNQNKMTDFLGDRWLFHVFFVVSAVSHAS